MADEPAGRTSLGVLHEILNNLGDSNTYLTVVDALEALLNVLGEGGIGEAVSDWLAAHPEATTTVQNGSITLLKLANDVKSAIDGKAASSDLQALADNLATLAQTVAEKADASDLDDKADIDGYYSQLTAGLAENLIGRGDAVPAEYLYRTARGTADIEDGIATIDCIKGNTLAWNQLVVNDLSTWVNPAFATKSVEGDVIKATVTSVDGSASFGPGTPSITTARNNHVLLAGLDMRVTSSASSVHAHFLYAAVSTGNIDATVPTGGWQHVKLIARVASENNFAYAIYYDWDKNLAIGDTVEVKNFQLFDLTLMFGAGNEPSTVEEFEAMFPLPYYPYSAPKLLPVDIRGVETVGFNQWDGAFKEGNQYFNYVTGEFDTGGGWACTDKIPAFPDTVYYVRADLATGSTPSLIVGCWDAGDNYLGSIRYNAFNGMTNATKPNTAYIRAEWTNPPAVTNVCINLSWSGYRNGEYEEHWSAERPIDTSRFFPTGMKKAGDKADALYADHYDTVVGAVDLGTLTWTYSDTYAVFMSSAISDISTGAVNNLKCSRYEPSPIQTSASPDKTIYIRILGTTGTGVGVKDSDYTDAAAFKAAMSGVILYYELATPTTTEIDPPLNLSYKVSDFGTERIMVDETADAPQTAPVPMEVEYGINAIDTIRRLPTEYQSHKSMGQLTAALESSLGIDITETWDEDDQRYEYEISDFELADDTFACIAAPDGPIATANHAVGTYLIMGGKLYKVTTAIATGDTIAVGTNVTQTTVMDELIALTA